MSGTYKMTEVVGTSSESFSDAVEQGIKRAAKNLRNVSWFEVVEQRGLVKEGKVVEFQATIKIGFKLED